MANIKKYKVDHNPTDAMIYVSIDFGFTSEFGGKIITMMQSIEGMSMFWSGSAERLEENSNDHLSTFLKHLCETIMGLSAAADLNVPKIKELFNNREGWCKLDGSEGVELIYFEEMELSCQDDYDVNEIK